MSEKCEVCRRLQWAGVAAAVPEASGLSPYGSCHREPEKRNYNAEECYRLGYERMREERDHAVAAGACFHDDLNAQRDDLLRALRELWLDADSHAEGAGEPEFSQFTWLAARARAAIQKAESK